MVPKPPSDVLLTQQTFPWHDRDVRTESYRSASDAPVRSTVFLLYGIGGMPGDGALLRSLAVDLARDGHEAVVVRYFDATGHWVVSRGVAMKNAPEWRQVLGAMLDDHAKRFPKRSLGVLGYSLGGFLSVSLAAETPEIDALVVLNGGILPEHESRDMSALPTTLLLHGAEDSIVEPKRSEVLEQLASPSGVLVRRVLLDGEGHALSANGKIRVSREVVEFFDENLRTGQSAEESIVFDSAD